MKQVAIIKCESYDYQAVKKAVEKGISLVGGIGKFVNQGEKILLKPNLLSASAPEKGVTTHPAVFKAAAELFLAAGAVVSYGDSPPTGNTQGAAKKSGLTAIADELGLKTADFKTGREVLFEEGRQNKKFVIAQGVLESDGVISLPKLKTHGLVRYTGCVKNQFGCIPGVLKGEFHVKLPDALNFAKMLVDLNNLIMPRLYIMDGIEAMEGNGPRGGNLRRMNVLLFSEDPIALDATACRLINLNPEIVPTIKFGMEFGAGTWLPEEIELLGDNFDELKLDNFEVDRTPVRPFKAGGIARFINNRLVPKPVINVNECSKCGICVSMCPADPKAVNLDDGDKTKAPIYDYGLCIRCYCCQEMCPEGAITLKVPPLRKALRGLRLMPN